MAHRNPALAILIHFAGLTDPPGSSGRVCMT